MKKIYTLLTLISVLAVACDPVPKQEVKTTTKENKEAVGFIYTSTNGEGENKIIQLTRYADGSLGDEKAYLTGGKGGSDSKQPVNGDYDSQGALQLIDGNLLCVNTGDNTISSFKVDNTTGKLSKKDLVDSHGNRPVSLTYTDNTAKPGHYWVVVANQWGTPTALFEGDKYVELPSKDFFKENLKGSDESDEKRNIVLYDFDAQIGKLSFVKVIDTYKRYWGGPVEVAFSGDGKKLAVSTWGIPHFVTESPDPNFVKPSQIHVYDFSFGDFNKKRTFEEEGLIGAVGFNWSKNNELLYVSYFNPIKSKDNQGLVVLKDSQMNIVKVSAHETGAPKDIDYACWTTLSPKKDKLYVVSFGTNVITPFSLNTNGSIKSSLKYEGIEEDNPANDLKDILITNDDKFAYCLGALQTYSIRLYTVGKEGIKYKSKYSVKETASEIGNTGVYDFQGLVGFDIKK